MAHPDPHRAGAERDQRRHAGQTGEPSDLGQQDKSQGRPGTHAPERRQDEQRGAAPSDGSGRARSPGSNADVDTGDDDVRYAPESGEKPEAMDPDRANSSGRS